MNCLRIADMQLFVEVALRHMIDAGDVGECHPGTNSADITGCNEFTVLFEALHGLNRL